MKNYLLLFSVLALLNCSKENSAVSESTKNSTVITDEKTKNLPEKPVKIPVSAQIKELNYQILDTLKSREIAAFAQFIHPDKGVLFSMYGYVDPATDKHFSRSDFIKYSNTNTKFTWGAKDGTGQQLVLSIQDYLADWVFKKDFSGAAYYFNVFKGSGNSLNNLKTIYPGAVFTENYIAGTEEYDGLDWNSLRFVFEKYEGKYFLVAVVNDQWTV
ncbi:hypothetical protein SAMN05421638_2259 [Kaistella treverensis]|uniref:Uncharacterized protein n=1 Tax=Kaistella treverensis TaxID=631455 RepID=A0A1I3NW08_9FLAO|nr:hypothetical protein [Kaistella treverensis]SFJ13421.1 hypothetical protein SAMN05421638_2259 [Kaistella treverensis]